MRARVAQTADGWGQNSFSWIVDWPGRRQPEPGRTHAGRLLVRKFLPPPPTEAEAARSMADVEPWPARQWGGEKVVASERVGLW